MDEKEIEQIICRYWDSAKWTNWMQLAAAELAVLFDQKLTILSRCLKTETDRADKYQARLAARDEGRVLWEGEANITHIRKTDGLNQPLLLTEIGTADEWYARFAGGWFGEDSQRVKVKIEELSEKSPEIQKAQDVEL